jgi:hypothetical protein
MEALSCTCNDVSSRTLDSMGRRAGGCGLSGKYSRWGIAGGWGRRAASVGYRNTPAGFMDVSLLLRPALPNNGCSTFTLVKSHVFFVLRNEQPANCIMKEVHAMVQHRKIARDSDGSNGVLNCGSLACYEAPEDILLRINQCKGRSPG